MHEVYYNEFDAFPAQWLVNLGEAGVIEKGFVDTRSIADVKPRDVKGYRRCHFFGGIGGWEYALRIAGWDDSLGCWTGSCPCQPFSISGEKKAEEDERDLWPDFFRLIRGCKPFIVFGEQVEHAIELGWLDRISDDLEGEGYAVRAVVLPACSVGADHVRKRLFWCAYANSKRRKRFIKRESLPLCDEKTFAMYCDTFADARRALAGDTTGLRSGDGLSLGVARSSIKGYGNAIVPQVAAVFVKAIMECLGVVAEAYG